MVNVDSLHLPSHLVKQALSLVNDMFGNSVERSKTCLHQTEQLLWKILTHPETFNRFATDLIEQLIMCIQTRFSTNSLINR